MIKEFPEFKYYPSDKEVDKWIDDIWNESSKKEYKIEIIEHQGYKINLGVWQAIEHTRKPVYVRFRVRGMDDFYCYWQPAPSGSGPLIVHLPGYGAEMSAHPELVMQGYNVLHINPLGYLTPDGPDETKKRDNFWPVLPDTVLSKAQKGYKQWFINCVTAVEWARKQNEVVKDRISFMGTSQGGGTSLIMGSIYAGADKGVKSVAADVPFLTNFPLARSLGSYKELCFNTLDKMKDKQDGWYALGFIDTLSHARRLNIPVMLTSGGDDVACPPETVKSLFEKLPSTKMYHFLEGQWHAHTIQFAVMSAAWFRLYA